MYLYYYSGNPCWSHLMIHLDSLYLKIKSIIKFWKMFPMFLGLGNLKNLWKHHLLVALSTLSQCRLSFLVLHLLWLKIWKGHSLYIQQTYFRWLICCHVGWQETRCWGSALIGHVTSHHWKKTGFVPEAHTWDGTLDDSPAKFSHYLWTNNVSVVSIQGGFWGYGVLQNQYLQVFFWVWCSTEMINLQNSRRSFFSNWITWLWFVFSRNQQR